MQFDEIRKSFETNYESVLQTITEKAKAGDRFFVELFLSHIMQMPVAVDRVAPAVRVDGGGWQFIFDEKTRIELLTGENV